MSSDRRRSTAIAICTLAALVTIGVSTGCGSKEPPEPPPLKNPAKTNDLKVQQRGMDLYLTMTYPATTLGGLALPGIDRVEWEMFERPAPEFMEQPEADIDDLEGDEATTGEPETGEAPDQEPADQEPEADPEGVDTGEADSEDPEASEPAEDTTKEGEQADDETGEGESEGEEAEELVEPNPFLQIRVDIDEFRKNAETVLVLEGEELEAAVVGGLIVARLPLEEIPSEPPNAYTFRAETFADRLRSPESNLASFVPLPPPAPPANIALEPDPTGIKLTWGEIAGELESDEGDELGSDLGDEPESDEEGEPEGDEEGQPEGDEEGQPEGDEEGQPEGDEEGQPEGDEEGEEEIEGFNIYRRLPQATMYPEPLATLTPDQTEYIDRSAQFGSRYVYALTTVRMRRPLVESPLSEELSVEFKDDFAPPAPRNLVVLAEAGRTRLVWDSSREADVVGYLVFTSQDDGEPVQLTPEPVRAPEYIHQGTVSGSTYRYFVTAVDSADNQSEPSEEVQTRAP